MNLLFRAKLLMMSGALVLGGLSVAAPSAHAFPGPIPCPGCPGAPADPAPTYVAVWNRNCAELDAYLYDFYDFNQGDTIEVDL
jgi:hypothetical protein